MILHTNVVPICVFVDLITGFFKHVSWKLMAELSDPDLRDLASRLPNTILHSQADSTVRKYFCAFRRWKRCGSSARPYEFALYTVPPAPRAVVEEACNALLWGYSCAGLANSYVTSIGPSHTGRELAK